VGVEELGVVAGGAPKVNPPAAAPKPGVGRAASPVLLPNAGAAAAEVEAPAAAGARAIGLRGREDLGAAEGAALFSWPRAEGAGEVEGLMKSSAGRGGGK
jgi:hypothetical protein